MMVAPSWLPDPAAGKWRSAGSTIVPDVVLPTM
jgi:hypothetical protein